MLTVIIGGARSGKSRFAVSLASKLPQVTYIATARAEDDEMRARIARHRAERPPHWRTIEEPLAIAEAAEACVPSCDLILLDCLTLWLSNLCCASAGESEATLRAAASAELHRLALTARRIDILAVTNEVGCGLVPESALGRMFRDLQGWINQDIARPADYVYHLVAGIATAIKRPEVAS
ncbi:MAG: bifunctional adenosylcobinamide kinase/adenosylcobinamide-phosphate guanylyltransferase [Bryobacteraceae bacterium]|jgi:adenosylcobinamide kinase/adenosylcobinamide-phosphate guanylyltransferase